MKQQIANRLGAAHVRDTVMQFVDGSMTREQAMEALGVGKTRLYELRTSFLAARAAGEADAWELIWAEWSRAAVGPRGRLLVDGVQCPTECANGTRVWVCRHVDGSISLVLNKPDLSTTPQVVFTTNPRVKRG